MSTAVFALRLDYKNGKIEVRPGLDTVDASMILAEDHFARRSALERIIYAPEGSGLPPVSWCKESGFNWIQIG